MSHIKIYMPTNSHMIMVKFKIFLIYIYQFKAYKYDHVVKKRERLIKVKERGK